MIEPSEPTTQPLEAEIAALSTIGIVILLPLNETLCAGWILFFMSLFTIWAMIGIPPKIDSDENCIDIGFRYRTRQIFNDLSKTKYEIIALVIPVRIVTTIVEDYLVPNPSSVFQPISPLILLVIGPLIEEYFFRGILQGRLSSIMDEKYAIILISIIFSYYHWIPGTPFDISLLTRFIRSLFYGLIYSKTRNILTSYVAHFGVNLWGLLP